MFLVQEKKASGVERVPSPQKSPVSRKSTDQWQTSMHHSGRSSGEGERGRANSPPTHSFCASPLSPFKLHFVGEGMCCEGWVEWDGVAMPFDITRSTSSDSLTSMTLGTLPPMTSGAMPFDITCWDMPLEQKF